MQRSSGHPLETLLHKISVIGKKLKILLIIAIRRENRKIPLNVCCMAYLRIDDQDRFNKGHGNDDRLMIRLRRLIC